MRILLCPAPNRRGIKRCFCLTSDICLSDVCLSVAYIGRNSRTERTRKTEIGTEVAHVTCDWDTTFKVNRSKVKVTRPLWLVVLACQHGHTVTVTYLYAYMTYIVSSRAGLGGAYRGGRPPTAQGVIYTPLLGLVHPLLTLTHTPNCAPPLGVCVLF